jgi:hypothetical protein
MEIYGVLPVGSIETIEESACGYRHVVMDYYNECVSRYNNVFKVGILPTPLNVLGRARTLMGQLIWIPIVKFLTLSCMKLYC